MRAETNRLECHQQTQWRFLKNAAKKTQLRRKKTKNASSTNTIKGKNVLLTNTLRIKDLDEDYVDTGVKQETRS